MIHPQGNRSYKGKSCEGEEARKSRSDYYCPKYPSHVHKGRFDQFSVQHLTLIFQINSGSRNCQKLLLTTDKKRERSRSKKICFDSWVKQKGME